MKRLVCSIRSNPFQNEKRCPYYNDSNCEYKVEYGTPKAQGYSCDAEPLDELDQYSRMKSDIRNYAHKWRKRRTPKSAVKWIKNKMKQYGEYEFANTIYYDTGYGKSLLKWLRNCNVDLEFLLDYVELPKDVYTALRYQMSALEPDLRKRELEDLLASPYIPKSSKVEIRKIYNDLVGGEE